jgi:hypothetical protein
MSWKNGYYYRSRRQGAHVRSEYIGSGMFAELIAEEDQLEAEQRAADQAAWQEEVRHFKQQDRAINDALDLVDTLADAALLQAGYHQHKRQWRRNRGRTDTQGN